LPPRTVSVGESAANEIPIAPGHGLGAVHFRLQPWESGHFIEDCGTGLGTLVNGKPVSWAPLKHGDLIEAGRLQMTYEFEGGASPAEATPKVKTAKVVPAEPAGAPEAAPRPPAWLPAEALLPPVPPSAQGVPPATSVGAAVWYFWFR
jgi:hypothetical protein